MVDAACALGMEGLDDAGAAGCSPGPAVEASGLFSGRGLAVGVHELARAAIRTSVGDGAEGGGLRGSSCEGGDGA